MDQEILLTFVGDEQCDRADEPAAQAWLVGYNADEAAATIDRQSRRRWRQRAFERSAEAAMRWLHTDTARLTVSSPRLGADECPPPFR
jgi:hypothetical protein